MEKEENTGHGTHTCKKRDAVHSGSYYLVSSISNGIYPHIEQVAVVLQTFKTTGTVRCPITSAPILLVAAGLIMLHDKKEDSALQLSGSDIICSLQFLISLKYQFDAVEDIESHRD